MQTQFPVHAGVVFPEFTKQPIKRPQVPYSMLTRFPVLAVNHWSRLYQKTDKGPNGTELEENTLGGTSERRRYRLYRKPIKRGHVPNSRLTQSPVLAVPLDKDFIRKPVNGGTCTELEANTCRYWRASYGLTLAKNP